MLIVDVANVIGSRPTGWWRDRAGAARDFVDRVQRAVADGTVDAPVQLVLEGKAKAGAAEGTAHDGVEVVHAAGSGDDTITALAAEYGDRAVVVTADRALAARLRKSGARVVGPNWLLAQIDE